MMAIWSRAALRDINAIATYIARDNPDAAGRVVTRITASVTRHERFPGLGRVGSVAGTREIVVPGLPYIVVYRVQDDIFEVVRVRHTAQQPPQN